MEIGGNNTINNLALLNVSDADLVEAANMDEMSLLSTADLDTLFAEFKDEDVEMDAGAPQNEDEAAVLDALDMMNDVTAADGIPGPIAKPADIDDNETVQNAPQHLRQDSFESIDSAMDLNNVDYQEVITRVLGALTSAQDNITTTEQPPASAENLCSTIRGSLEGLSKEFIKPAVMSIKAEEKELAELDTSMLEPDAKTQHERAQKAFASAKKSMASVENSLSKVKRFFSALCNKLESANIQIKVGSVAKENLRTISKQAEANILQDDAPGQSTSSVQAELNEQQNQAKNEDSSTAKDRHEQLDSAPAEEPSSMSPDSISEEVVTEVSAKSTEEQITRGSGKAETQVNTTPSFSSIIKDEGTLPRIGIKRIGENLPPPSFAFDDEETQDGTTTPSSLTARSETKTPPRIGVKLIGENLSPPAFVVDDEEIQEGAMTPTSLTDRSETKTSPRIGENLTPPAFDVDDEETQEGAMTPSSITARSETKTSPRIGEKRIGKNLIPPSFDFDSEETDGPSSPEKRPRIGEKRAEFSDNEETQDFSKSAFRAFRKVASIKIGEKIAPSSDDEGVDVGSTSFFPIIIQDTDSPPFVEEKMAPASDNERPQGVLMPSNPHAESSLKLKLTKMPKDTRALASRKVTKSRWSISENPGSDPRAEAAAKDYEDWVEQEMEKELDTSLDTEMQMDGGLSVEALQKLVGIRRSTSSSSTISIESPASMSSDEEEAFAAPSFIKDSDDELFVPITMSVISRQAKDIDIVPSMELGDSIFEEPIEKTSVKASLAQVDSPLQMRIETIDDTTIDSATIDVSTSVTQIDDGSIIDANASELVMSLFIEIFSRMTENDLTELKAAIAKSTNLRSEQNIVRIIKLGHACLSAKKNMLSTQHDSFIDAISGDVWRDILLKTLSGHQGFSTRSRSVKLIQAEVNFVNNVISKIRAHKDFGHARSLAIDRGLWNSLSDDELNKTRADLNIVARSRAKAVKNISHETIFAAIKFVLFIKEQNHMGILELSRDHEALLKNLQRMCDEVSLKQTPGARSAALAKADCTTLCEMISAYQGHVASSIEATTKELLLN